MRFSSRIPASLEANRVTRAVAEMRRDGVPFVDLTESNPTRAGLSYDADLLVPLGQPRGLAYRPEPLGHLDARLAVSEDFARRGLSVDAGRIALTASTSEAYSLLFKLLCDAGDEVLIPQPSYPLFEHLTTLDAVRAVPYRLEYHGRWSIDLASVEQALSPRTRAVLVVNPNNPTGNFVSARDLDDLAQLCGPRDIAVISDDVFADYELQPDTQVPRGQLSARTDILGFALGGLSKSIGLPQAKLGWIAVTGDTAACAETMPRLELACDTYLSVSTPVQLAARELLVRGAAIRHQIQARVRANLAACSALVSRYPACRLLHAEGGWSCVIQVPTLVPEEELVLSLLVDSHVLTHPGYFFDFATESFLIVSLLTPEDAFVTAVSRVLDRFRMDARP